MALPVTMQAVGTHLFFQGMVLVPGANPGGWVFSAALDALLGTP